MNQATWQLFNIQGHITLERVQQLIRDGADIHASHPIGDTVIHTMVRYADLSILEYIIEKGADVNQQCKPNGKTPLHQATGCTNVGMMEFLLKHNADPNVQDFDGNTPLHIAINNNTDNGALRRDECITLLLKYNARINVQNANGDTFAHQLANSEYYGVIEALQHVLVLSTYDPVITKQSRINNWKKLRAVLLALQRKSHEDRYYFLPTEIKLHIFSYIPDFLAINEQIFKTIFARADIQSKQRLLCDCQEEWVIRYAKQYGMDKENLISLLRQKRIRGCTKTCLMKNNQGEQICDRVCAVHRKLFLPETINQFFEKTTTEELQNKLKHY